MYTEIVDKLDIVYFSLRPILIKYTEIVDNLDIVYKRVPPKLSTISRSDCTLFCNPASLVGHTKQIVSVITQHSHYLVSYCQGNTKGEDFKRIQNEVNFGPSIRGLLPRPLYKTAIFVKGPK